ISDTVEEVRGLEFERAFVLRFSSGQVLLFKLHGSRSNILLYPQEEDLPSGIFRNELKEDKELQIKALSNPLVLDWDRFVSLKGNASQFLPTLGKVPRQWLKDNGYIDASLERKWQLMEELMDMLEHPVYAIVQESGQYILTLLPVTGKI